MKKKLNAFFSDELIIGLVLLTLPISIVANSISLGVFIIYFIVKYGRPNLKNLLKFSALIVLFLCHIYGFLISDDKHNALNMFIPYLPFLSFPMGFSLLLTHNKKINIERSFLYLVSGVLAITIYALIRAGIDVLYHNERFDYGRGVQLVLTYTPHHVYLGIFYLFSIALIAKLYSENKIHKLYLFFIPLLFLMIFILPSRIIMLIAITILPLMLHHYFKKFISRKKIIYLFVSFIIGLIITLSTADYTRDKITHTFFNLMSINTKEKPFNGISYRRQIWKNSTNLIHEKWIVGYGIGDAQNELNQTYIKNNIKQFINMNAHNQYLQYFLYYGIPITLVLIFLLIQHLYRLYRNKKYFYAYNLLILMLVFLTDSIINRQLGIVYFSLLLTASYYELQKGNYETR